MNFAYPQGRIFLVLAFAAAILAVLALVRKRRALRRLARQGIHQPGVLVRPVRQIVKCVLLLLGVLLLGIALLGPQWGWMEEEFPPRKGRDVVLVLDVSRSMLAEDVAPNRLERARTELRDLADYLERAGGYRIGLISFAERSAVLCPLTSDYRCFAEELADASLKSLRLRGHAAWGDGTRISTALDRAGQIIDDDNAAYTDVLLVSDGGDMARETLEAADALARRGITVHTLGLGDSAHGSLIPVPRSSRPAGASALPRRVGVHSVARGGAASHRRASHGRYFAAGTGYLELDRPFGDLLAAKKSLERQFVHRERHGIHRFQWFVAPALVLLLIQWLLSDARPGRTALEQPNYFHWVRRRHEKSTNHRVTENTENGKQQKHRRLSLLIATGLFLCVLCDSVVSSFLPAVSAEPTQAVDPWTAFRHGNELLRQAQQAGTKADSALLVQAQRQYRKCLARQASTPDAGTLFEDARYNLEVAKLLLMQISRSGTNAGQPGPRVRRTTKRMRVIRNARRKARTRRRSRTRAARIRPANKFQGKGFLGAAERKDADKTERKKEKGDAEKTTSDDQKNKSDSGQNRIRWRAE